MPKCPVCESFQVVIVVSPWPSAWCDGCGARWVQEGSEQRRIMREPVVFGGVQRITTPAVGGALGLAARTPSGFVVGTLAS